MWGVIFDDSLGSDQASKYNVRDSSSEALMRGRLSSRMIEMLIAMDNLEFLFAWFTTPNPNFGGASPVDMMLADRGHVVAQFVLEAKEAEEAAKAVRGADNGADAQKVTGCGANAI